MRRAGPFFEAVIRLRRFLTIAFVLLAVGATMFARTGGRGAAQPEKKVVDLKADVMYPIEFRDTSAVCLVGNVAFYHSGAVITCDSAVRYSEKHMECFGNVLINKNDTYVYGDRADYNGETHVANVYSDLVKVVDGDATLYTYKFLFNTKTNVGEFADGGVVTNRENQLESDRGYYYANDRTVICVDRVEIRSEEYDLTGDSVVYNLTTDHAYYFRHTNIWNTQGDYLYADRGSYDKGGELYTVTENGYILTEKQEVWSDSIDYYKLAGHAVLRGNIQIDDTEHKVLAFGDFGEYWKEPGNAFLTRRPAVVSYDTSQGDSLFMAADSMFLYTIDPARQRADSLRAAARAADSLHADSLRTDSLRVDSLAPAAGDSVQGVRPEAPIVAARRGSLSEGRGDAKRNGTERTDSLAPRRADSLRRDSLAADSLHVDSLLRDSLQQDTVVMTKEQRKQLLREAAAREKAELKAKRDAERQAKLDTIAARRLAKTRAKLDAQRAKDSLRNARLAAACQAGTARTGRQHETRFARPAYGGSGLAGGGQPAQGFSGCGFAVARLAGADACRFARFAGARYDLPVGQRIPQRAHLPLRLPVGMRFAGGRFARLDHSSLHRSRAVEPEQPDHFGRDGHLYGQQPDRSGGVRRAAADGLRVGYDALQPGGGQDDDRPVPQ